MTSSREPIDTPYRPPRSELLPADPPSRAWLTPRQTFWLIIVSTFGNAFLKLLRLFDVV